MVVEDDPAVRRGIRENLEREKFRVVVESDGARALDRVRRSAPDLLILDVMLPSMSGFEICAKLKEEGYLAPVFLLTGLTDDSSRLKGLGLGADDYLAKPFSVQELLLRVRNTLVRSDRMAGTTRAIEAELVRAREIQRTSLPRRSPRTSGLDVYGTMLPATYVGGDYFDYPDTGDKRFGVIVADVSGKGLAAALYVHAMQGVVRASGATSPTDVLLRLQKHLGVTMDPSSFLTASVAFFDPERRRVDIACAGHPPVMYRRGTILFEVPADGTVIGPSTDSFFEKLLRPASLELNDGDVFYFYSDGITEAMNESGEEFGTSRLKQALAVAQGTARLSANRLLSGVRNFVGRHVQSDDMTVVTVRVTGKGSAQ